jgi:hypothetical protein
VSASCSRVAGASGGVGGWYVIGRNVSAGTSWSLDIPCKIDIEHISFNILVGNDSVEFGAIAYRTEIENSPIAYCPVSRRGWD